MMAPTTSADESPSPRSSSGGTRPAESDRRTTLLDAAVRRFVAVGITKTTMEDISREAGAGKATLYRHFPNKKAVVEGLVERENQRFDRELRGAAAAAESHAGSLEDAFVAALEFLRTHPMLTKSLAEEPEVLLPYLTLRSGPVARSTTALFHDIIEHGQRAGVFGPMRADWAAETLFRLVMSFFILPTMMIDVDDPDEVRGYARELAASMLDGGGTAQPGEGAVAASRPEATEPADALWEATSTVSARTR